MVLWVFRRGVSTKSVRPCAVNRVTITMLLCVCVYIYIHIYIHIYIGYPYICIHISDLLLCLGFCISGSTIPLCNLCPLYDAKL